MTTKERLLQAIETTPEPILAILLSFLEVLQKPENLTNLANLNLTVAPTPAIPDSQPNLKGSKAKDLVQFAGTWQGDDFEECLDAVYQNRSQIEL